MFSEAKSSIVEKVQLLICHIGKICQYVPCVVGIIRIIPRKPLFFMSLNVG